MGRQSRQVVCGERNGRTLFAPTHICTDYKKIRKKIKNVEVQKSGVSDFCKTKNAPIQGTFLYYFSVLNGASGMPVSLKIVTSQ